jgi:hypothetical protein
MRTDGPEQQTLSVALQGFSCAHSERGWERVRPRRNWIWSGRLPPAAPGFLDDPEHVSLMAGGGAGDAYRWD